MEETATPIQVSGNPLQEEKDTGIEDKFLTFWTDQQLFGLPVTTVVQITAMQEITAIPRWPRYAKGIINLRGDMVPVIDLRARMEKPEIAYGSRTCVIVTAIHGKNFGLLVDTVDAVVSIPAGQITEPPALDSDAVSQYLTGIARLSENGQQDKVVLCIDVSKLLQKDEISALEAARGSAAVI